ncbi:hypothetical protein IQ249_16905 [Lusitaniella coriacea LEGE 07157]|uniref:Uncharacterized protein n=1 Tax=Lusitaniella coriacea LEGE 07157 TaxID=945747 RepID=A0A8J7DY40_9CYAN|nr:hypothetical protein [Lusitaniella coriacea]MBE9117579.1 hypothetical protein [Lusitaniella coriacea LEGE 07157]
MTQENFQGNPNQATESQVKEIVLHLQQQDIFVVNSRRRNGLIIYKRYHAEFAGPGAVVGSLFDLKATHVVPVGDLSLLVPETLKEREKAYLLRRQWVRLIQQITDNPDATQRAKLILNQFENWFDAQTAAQLPDEAFALLVGVFPRTIHQVRSHDHRLL